MEYPVYYSLEEARLLLPILEEKLLKLIQIQKALEFLSTVNVENESGGQEIDLMITKLNMKYYKKIYLYHKYIAQLLSLGVVIKDLQQGLIDFNAKYGGRDIFLCWRIGEKDIHFWHEIEEGFAGRQPIERLEKKTA